MSTNAPWGWLLKADAWIDVWVCPRCGAWTTHSRDHPCSNPFWRYDGERDEWRLARARLRGWWSESEKQQREGGG